MLDELRFENTVKLTESEYVAVWGDASPPRNWKFFGLLALGILCLFTPYTLLLGLALLGLAIVALITPLILPGGARHRYRQSTYLQEALTYGVSEHKLWIRGTSIDACVPWSMLFNWREKGDWLVLTPLAIPPLYLSVARLKEKGVYGRVRALAASNAAEFNRSQPE